MMSTKGGKLAPCMLRISKEGYRDQDVTFTKSMTPWYLGNILLGGIVGFIVDAANGAMYDRKPAGVDVKLEPIAK